MGKETMKEYVVIYESGPTSWGAYSPDVPGCIAVGDLREEVEQFFKEALEMHIEIALVGDEAYRAVGQTLRTAHVLHRFAERQFENRNQTTEFRRRFGTGRLGRL